jgi:hypothetical protein
MYDSDYENFNDVELNIKEKWTDITYDPWLQVSNTNEE